MTEDRLTSKISLRVTEDELYKLGVKAVQERTSLQAVGRKMFLNWLRGDGTVQIDQPISSPEHGLKLEGLGREDLRIIAGVAEMLTEKDRRAETIRIQVDHWASDKEEAAARRKAAKKKAG